MASVPGLIQRKIINNDILFVFDILDYMLFSILNQPLFYSI